MCSPASGRSGRRRGLPPSRELKAIHRARLCYDHFAGELGVAMTSALVERGWLVPEDRDFRLTEAGEEFFAGFGIDLDAAPFRSGACSRGSASTGANGGRTSRAPSGPPSPNGPSTKAGSSEPGKPRDVAITRHGEAELERPLRLLAPRSRRAEPLPHDETSFGSSGPRPAYPGRRDTHILEGAVEDAMTERHAFCTG